MMVFIVCTGGVNVGKMRAHPCMMHADDATVTGHQLDVPTVICNRRVLSSRIVNILVAILQAACGIEG
jgi:hypothetical protein